MLRRGELIGSAVVLFHAAGLLGGPPQAPVPPQAPPAVTPAPHIVSNERVGGVWYNVYSDGSYRYCSACNAGVRASQPAVVQPAPVVVQAPQAAVVNVSVEGDGLDEVNARRMRSGLPPLIRDPLLTVGARSVAAFRAARGMFGHTANDFAFLPAGGSARMAGCAAYPAGMGWYSCGVESRATFAGAYWVTGPDGRRFMHLFVR